MILSCTRTARVRYIVHVGCIQNEPVPCVIHLIHLSAAFAASSLHGYLTLVNAKVNHVCYWFCWISNSHDSTSALHLCVVSSTVRKLLVIYLKWLQKGTGFDPKGVCACEMGKEGMGAGFFFYSIDGSTGSDFTGRQAGQGPTKYSRWRYCVKCMWVYIARACRFLFIYLFNLHPDCVPATSPYFLCCVLQWIPLEERTGL